MESESSQYPLLSSSSTPPQNPIEAFIGSFVTLISNYDLRYEGVLCYINLQDSTLGLQNVMCYGTEERTQNGFQIHPINIFYDYILFRGIDIKEVLVKTQCGYNGGYYSCLAREAIISKQCHDATTPPLPLMVSPYNPNGAKIPQKYPLIYNENLITPPQAMTDSSAYSVMGPVNDGLYSASYPFAQPQFLPGSYYHDNSMLHQAHINAAPSSNQFQSFFTTFPPPPISMPQINGRVDFEVKNFRQFKLWDPPKRKEEESAKAANNPFGPIASPVKHTEEISNNLQRSFELHPPPYNFTIDYNMLF
ncbi:Decapping 5-like protein [Cardamine amara subsp. amara]|uniref:Decapping 5-like protein n=1 Tax=Cardamine amara subsp. amara TaxID=228776 RepID=A0ABD1C5L6_CARAN